MAECGINFNDGLERTYIMPIRDSITKSAMNRLYMFYLHNYKIIRTLNPSKLLLFCDGKDVTRDSIKNTEDDIFSILNASPSIFEKRSNDIGSL